MSYILNKFKILLCHGIYNHEVVRVIGGYLLYVWEDAPLGFLHIPKDTPRSPYPFTKPGAPEPVQRMNLKMPCNTLHSIIISEIMAALRRYPNAIHRLGKLCKPFTAGQFLRDKQLLWLYTFDFLQQAAFVRKFCYLKLSCGHIHIGQTACVITPCNRCYKVIALCI